MIQSMAAELQSDVKSVSAEARALLTAYDWPGNIRELQNALRRALVMAEGPMLRAIDLPATIRGIDEGTAGIEAPTTLAESVTRAVERLERGLIVSALAECRGSRTQTAMRLGINRKTLFTKLKQYGLAESDDES